MSAFKQIAVLVSLVLLGYIIGEGIEQALKENKVVNVDVLEPITGTWVAEWNDRGFTKTETLYLVEHSSGKVLIAPSENPRILEKVQFELVPGLDARRIELRITNNNYGPPVGYFYPLSKAIEFHYGNTLIHCTKDPDSPIKWKLVLPSEK